MSKRRIFGKDFQVDEVLGGYTAKSDFYNYPERFLSKLSFHLFILDKWQSSSFLFNYTSSTANFANLLISRINNCEFTAID